MLFGKSSIVKTGICMLLSLAVHAQNDAEGCKDHPMFNRMPNTYINECTHNFNEMDIQTGDDKRVKKEGTKTYINYTYDNDKPGTPPSFFQIVKNYENAVGKLGGKKVFFQNGTSSTLFVKTAGKEVWLVLEDFTPTNGDGNFAISILEIEEMQQDIQASAILDKLNKEGHIALYINFETGKSDIKPESQKIIDQVASMLVQNNGLKVSIEGHTDNVGTPASNQTLSTGRANAVVAALINKGIEKSRLTAKGWGQTKPVADNKTEDGKAKNRRVEIVKQ
jgi:outer membrane protein OmpA-like peptidoglycan-associated protein